MSTRVGFGRAATVAIAIALISALLATSTIFAQTPTPSSAPTDTPSPTASPSPEPTASPSPYPQSTITIRFVAGGQQVTVGVDDGTYSLILADGDVCFVPLRPDLAVRVQVSQVIVQWPYPPGTGWPDVCSKGPPTALRFDFHTDYGTLSTEAVWTGSNMTLDVQVPIATATPGALPDSGGSAAPPFDTTPLPVLLIAMSAFVLMGLGVVVGRCLQKVLHT